MAKQSQVEVRQKTLTYLPIEDHGIIGDLHTVALVGKNGTIDWWCTPSFDAPSVFASILDAEKGGSFGIAPKSMRETGIKQYYFPNTNVLGTRFLSPDGIAEIIDFMTIQDLKQKTPYHGISRAIRVVNGTMTLEMNCNPAFNYARDPHTLKISSKGAIFNGKDLSLGLSSSVPLDENGHRGVKANFTLNKDEMAFFQIESFDKDRAELESDLSKTVPARGDDTADYWRKWIGQCKYKGRWREMVYRSALTLKLLTYAPTGALVAAPTTSLPEGVGGERNWDYRFTWLRDSAFTLHSLLKLGFYQEAADFAKFVNDRIDESEDGHLQPMFTIEGKHELNEENLDHLDGYRHSRPVRIGNEAYKQIQLDVYGETLDAAYMYAKERGIQYRGYQSILRIMEWLSRNWGQPDEGIWEVRGGRRAFLHSRLMCWVAFDRALKIIEQRGFPIPADEWRSTRDAIFKEIMEKGWSEKKQSFVQYYGSDAVDASALLVSLTGFISGNDQRMVKTIERMQRELMNEPHLYRYRVDAAASDGLKGTEGTFSICSFWLVEALTNAGRLAEARRYLEEMFTYANHLGLYSEEVGSTGEALGNFPQAFTHLALISSCMALDEALERAVYTR